MSMRKEEVWYLDFWKTISPRELRCPKAAPHCLCGKAYLCCRVQATAENLPAGLGVCTLSVVADVKDLDRVLTWWGKGGGHSLSWVHVPPAIEQHVLPACSWSHLCHQGAGVGRIQLTLSRSSSCPFFLWSQSSPCAMKAHVVALLLTSVCTRPVALPLHLLACSAWPAGPVQMSPCETQPPWYADC